MAGGEVVLRKTAMATPAQRSRLANITNFPNTVANRRFSDESKLYKSWNEGSVNGNGNAHLQHQQEIKILQLALREKKAEIEGYKAALEAVSVSMEEMQRDLEASLMRRAKQNDDIIAYNSHMAKEVYSLRDELKLLQHEHTGMMLAYRISDNELQVKLGELTEQLRALLQEKQNKGTKDGSTAKAGRRTESSAHRRQSMGPGAFAPGLWNSSTKPKSLNDLYSTASVTTRRGVREPKAAILAPVTPSNLIQVTPRSSSHVRYRHLTSMGPLEEDEGSPEAPTPKVLPRRDLDNLSVEDNAGCPVPKDPEVQVTNQSRFRNSEEIEIPISLEESRSSSMAMAFDRFATLTKDSGMHVCRTEVAVKMEDEKRGKTFEGIEPQTPHTPAMVPSMASKSYPNERLRPSAVDPGVSHESPLCEEVHPALMRRLGATVRSTKKQTEPQPKTLAAVAPVEDGCSSSSRLTSAGRPRRKAAEAVTSYTDASPDDYEKSSKSSISARSRQHAVETASMCVKSCFSSGPRDSFSSELSEFERITISSKTPGTIRKGGDDNTCAKRESGLQLKTPGPTTASKKVQPSKSVVKGRPRQEPAQCKEESHSKEHECCRRSSLTGRPRRRAAEAVVSYMESPI